MGISIITRNYQVTLPKDIREMQNFKIGDKVLFVANQKEVRLKKITKNLTQETAGIWKELKETGQDYQKSLRAEWKKRLF